MQKIVIAKAGSYDQLELKTAPDLSPRASEVVVDVDAIGVNYADCIVRMGLYASAREFVGWPITPGFEVAGRVSKLGDRVDDLPVGTPVIAVTRFNGYATEVCVPRDQVFRVPASLSVEQAAAIPAVFMTAYFAIHELAHPRKGARVLVHSAAGGVGGCLVQISKLGGATVVGVVGAPHKVAAARDFGCDHVIDKSTEQLWKTAERLAPEGYDAVFDANGVATLKQSYEHVRAAGKLVVYGFHSMMPRVGGRPNYPKLALDYLRTPRFNPLDMTNECRSVMAFNLSYLFDRNDVLQQGMTQVLDWLEAGSVVAPPIKTYPLTKAAEAHRDIESGKTVGKLVLLPR